MCVHLDVISHCLTRYKTTAARVDTLERDCELYRARGRSARVSSRVLLPEPLRPSDLPASPPYILAFSPLAAFDHAVCFLEI